MIKVVIVEDIAGIRLNLEQLINDEPGIKCVGSFTTGEEALKRIPALLPDLAIMDINLPGISGIQCTARLKELLPRLQILMVTVHSDNDRVFAALEAGASGYLLKRTPANEMISAIRDVMQGGAPMTGEVARRVISSFRRSATHAKTETSLTEREEEILSLLSQGYSNKELAGKLFVSYETVRTHLCHIYEKLHVRSRTEAASKYLKDKRSDSAPRSSAKLW